MPFTRATTLNKTKTKLQWPMSHTILLMRKRHANKTINTYWRKTWDMIISSHTWLFATLFEDDSHAVIWCAHVTSTLLSGAERCFWACVFSTLTACTASSLSTVNCLMRSSSSLFSDWNWRKICKNISRHNDWHCRHQSICKNISRHNDWNCRHQPIYARKLVGTMTDIVAISQYARTLVGTMTDIVAIKSKLQLNFFAKLKIIVFHWLAVRFCFYFEYFALFLTL